MRTRFAVGGLLAAALLSSTALAQTTAPAPAPATNAAATTHKGNVVRLEAHRRSTSTMEQNEKLGDISEIILQPNGLRPRLT